VSGEYVFGYSTSTEQGSISGSCGELFCWLDELISSFLDELESSRNEELEYSSAAVVDSLHAVNSDSDAVKKMDDHFLKL
jgi:hypothetical protein